MSTHGNICNFIKTAVFSAGFSSFSQTVPRRHKKGANENKNLCFCTTHLIIASADTSQAFPSRQFPRVRGNCRRSRQKGLVFGRKRGTAERRWMRWKQQMNLSCWSSFAKQKHMQQIYCENIWFTDTSSASLRSAPSPQGEGMREQQVWWEI